MVKESGGGPDGKGKTSFLEVERGERQRTVTGVGGLRPSNGSMA